jgi:hypothetical protein
MKTWIYLTDLGSLGAVWNPETDEVRTITPGYVNSRLLRLRRGILREEVNGLFTETGEVAPMTPTLFERCVPSHVNDNGWVFTWPHPVLDYDDETSERETALIRDRLHREMSIYPYQFTILEIQRRFLFYYSDGDYLSQKSFIGYQPLPHSYPFYDTRHTIPKYRDSSEGETGELRKQFQNTDGPNEVDTNVVGAPLLYRGPAYVVRFLLDGQEVAYNGCRVMVTPEGDFICSDWCQRHDFSSYSDGINLQLGIYSFASWVTGPCLQRATAHGGFKPTAKMTRTAIRLVKAVEVPTFDAAVKAVEPTKKNLWAQKIQEINESNLPFHERYAEALKVAETGHIAIPIAIEPGALENTLYPAKAFWNGKVHSYGLPTFSGKCTAYVGASGQMTVAKGAWVVDTDLIQRQLSIGPPEELNLARMQELSAIAEAKRRETLQRARRRFVERVVGEVSLKLRPRPIHLSAKHVLTFTETGAPGEIWHLDAESNLNQPQKPLSVFLKLHAATIANRLADLTERVPAVTVGQDEIYLVEPDILTVFRKGRRKICYYGRRPDGLYEGLGDSRQPTTDPSVALFFSLMDASVPQVGDLKLKVGTTEIELSGIPIKDGAYVDYSGDEDALDERLVELLPQLR